MYMQECSMLKLDEGLILLIYFALKPLYFFKSGLPQISDMFLFAMIIYLLLRDRGNVVLPKASFRWISVFAFTLIYQILIDLIWTGITGDTKMLVNATHYVFNFLAAVLCIMIGNMIGVNNLVKTIALGCLICSLVIALGLVLNHSTGIRHAGFFNNPNQLGYYSLILLSCVFLFEDEFSVYSKVIVIGITLFASAISLSKAAIIGVGGLAVSYTLFGNNERSVRKTVFQIIFIVLICALTYWILFSDSRYVMNSSLLRPLRNRILNMSRENDSSLSDGRGYARIFEMGIHFLWGMGEGAYRRFISLSGLEVHSTYVNILVSYGFFGMLSYAWIILKPLFGGKYTGRNFAGLSGVLLYFMAHNGVRNTLLWIILAALLQISTTKKQIEMIGEKDRKSVKKQIRQLRV